MAYWLNMRTHNTGVVSSIPPSVTFNTPLVRKATRNHLMNSTSLEKLRALPLVSATLVIEYATQMLHSFVLWKLCSHKSLNILRILTWQAILLLKIDFVFPQNRVCFESLQSLASPFCCDWLLCFLKIFLVYSTEVFGS